MSDPAAYAKSHWLRHETDAEHAERVESAEREAGWYFTRATAPQKAAYDAAMAAIRGLPEPAWSQRKLIADAAWARDTVEAAALFNVSADEVMAAGEVSEETGAKWDALIAVQVAQSAEAA